MSEALSNDPRWSNLDPRIASAYELMWMGDAEFDEWEARVMEIVRQMEEKTRIDSA